MTDLAQVHRARLEGFQRGSLSRRQARELVLHLIAGCDLCSSATARWWIPGAKPSSAGAPAAAGGAEDHDYGPMFDRLARRLDRRQVERAEERAAVPALRRELERHPPDRQRMLIANSRRYQSWSLAEDLLDDCYRQRPRNSRVAHRLAELALVVIERLDRAYYGEALTSDLCARGWVELGTSLRALGDYPQADHAFARARLHLRRGTGDPVEKANLLWLEASLHMRQRRFDRAAELLDQTIAIARRVDDSHLWGKALITRAMCEGDQGRLEAEIELLRQGLARIDANLEPRLEAVVHHNLILSLIDAERFAEAEGLMGHTRALHHKLGNHLDLVRFGWVEAIVHRGLGRNEQAERLYLETLRAFETEGLGLDAALVCLELASLYSEQRRSTEMRRLAETILPILQAGGLPRGAEAAMMMLHKEALRERVTGELISEVAEFLEKARINPALCFRERA